MIWGLQILESMRSINDKIEWNKKRQKNEFFINRYGKVIKYNGDLTGEICSFHSEIASQVFPNTDYASDTLMKLGWVMVGSSAYSTPIINKKPTQAQINKLDKLGLYDILHFSHEGFYINWKEYGILCE